jgi:hypothetical protein
MVGFLRFWGGVVMHAPKLLEQAASRRDLLITLVLLLGGTWIGAWLRFVPWWLPFAALLVFGLMWSIYDKFQQVEDENRKLRERLAAAAKRKALNDLLGDALEEGRSLSRGKRYIQLEDERPNAEDKYQGAIHGWVHHTRELIEAAFGKAEAQHFISNEGYTEEELLGLKPNAKFKRHFLDNPYLMKARIKRLHELIRRAHLLNVDSDFNPQDWIKR